MNPDRVPAPLLEDFEQGKYHVFSCPSVCKCTVSTETALYQDILGKDVLL